MPTLLHSSPSEKIHARRNQWQFGRNMKLSLTHWYSARCMGSQQGLLAFNCMCDDCCCILKDNLSLPGPFDNSLLIAECEYATLQMTLWKYSPDRDTCSKLKFGTGTTLSVPVEVDWLHSDRLRSDVSFKTCRHRTLLTASREKDSNAELCARHREADVRLYTKVE